MGRATLVGAGLHDLTTPKMHSPYVAIRLVSSYLTFSPLPGNPISSLVGDSLGKLGGCFLLHYSVFAGSFPLGSRMLYVARTFLFYQIGISDKPADCFTDCKGKQFNWNVEISLVILYF